MAHDNSQQFMAAVGPLLPRLHRIARALCGDGDLAQDLTQEALLRGLQASDSFDPSRPLLPWLARIMRNLFVNYCKSGRLKYEVCDEEAIGAVCEPAEGGALAQLERAELLRCLREEIAGLPRPFQLVVILCDQEGFGYEDAAAVAGVPVGTVRSRLARARAELRTRLRARVEQLPSAAVPVRGNPQGPSLVSPAEAGSVWPRQPVAKEIEHDTSDAARDGGDPAGAGVVGLREPR